MRALHHRCTRCPLSSVCRSSSSPSTSRENRVCRSSDDGYVLAVSEQEVRAMPPRGTKKGTKRARQYEHIKDSLRDRGSSESTSRGDRGSHREQGARSERRGEDVVEALARGHLVGTSRRPSQPAQGPARPDARPALRGGEGSQHPRALEDDEGRAPAGARGALTGTPPAFRLTGLAGSSPS